MKVKVIKKPSFIKSFNSLKEAEVFAKTSRGKIITHYDWDGYTNKITKEFYVKY